MLMFSRRGVLFGSQALHQPVEVRLDAARLERPRGFGAVWLGLRLWQALELL
jgi:hypothetical protein